MFDTQPFYLYNILVMKNFKKVVSLMLILSTTLALSGCTTFNNFKYAFFGGNSTNKETTIKIGVYEPMSGEYSKQGKEEIAGIELAHELFPEVLGKKIELIYADNKSNMDDAKSALETLYAQNPDIVIGSYGEVFTIMNGDYAKASSTPSIAVTSVNPLITKNNEYYFTTTFSEEKQGEALADYAVKGIGAKKFATVKLYNDDTAQAVIKRFANRLKKIADDKEPIVASVNLEHAAQDYTSAINYLKESKVGCVLLATSEAVSEKFITQCEEQGYTYPLFIGTKDWDNETFRAFALQHPIMSFAFATEKTIVDTERYEVLHSAYDEKYGSDTEPTAVMALGFDAYSLAYRTLEKTGEWIDEGAENKYISKDASEAEIKAIRQAVEESKKTGIPAGPILRAGLKSIIHFKGASGIITFVDSNEATKTITIAQYIRGIEYPQYVVE